MRVVRRAWAGARAGEVRVGPARGHEEWHVGAFDLCRPDGWIIDFKAHQIGSAAVVKTAEGYRVQMALYRRAAGIIGPVRTQLHFTHPAVVVEIS